MLTNNISFLTIIGAWFRLNYRASPIREFYCFMVTLMIFCRLLIRIQKQGSVENNSNAV